MYSGQATKEQEQYSEKIIEDPRSGYITYTGKKENILTGAIGEVFSADELGVPRPEGDGFDSGWDFLINDARIDIKTSGTKKQVQPSFDCSVFERQIDYNVDYYVFCFFNKTTKEVVVAGYISREEFEEKSILSDFSDEKVFKVKQWNLKPINSREDFRNIGK